MLRIVSFAFLFLPLCGCVAYGGYYYAYDPYAPSSYTQLRTTTYVYDEPLYEYVYTTPTVVYYHNYWWCPYWWSAVWIPYNKEYHYYYVDYRRNYHRNRYGREHRSAPRRTSSKSGHFFNRSRSNRIFR